VDDSSINENLPRPRNPKTQRASSAPQACQMCWLGRALTKQNETPWHLTTGVHDRLVGRTPTQKYATTWPKTCARQTTPRRMTRDLTRPGELSNVWNAWKRDRLRRPGRPPPQADETDVELFLMNLMKSYCLSDISPSWTHYRKDPGCGLCCVTERYVPRLGYLKERGRTPRRVVFRRHKAVADVSQ
jgi:hypothetical protein